METQLLSVIVPCYKTEKYVESCIRSIMAQSYRNIEIVCVDDYSPDDSFSILDRLSKEDDRIHIVRHEKNKGLFHARLTGVSVAKGEYIAFVDSDDTITCDWFRPLIGRAEKENADMVLGNIIEVDENGWKHYSNICRNLPKAIKCLHGDEVYKTFMSQHGSLFYWHVVWNKVYRKSFFDSCLPYYEAITDHLIMTEDIAFSCVLYSYAKNVQLVDNDCYFYYRHKDASTSNSLPQEKIVKNLNDVIRVFAFFKNVLINRGIYDEVESDYIKFRDKYFRIWCNSITVAGLRDNKEVTNLLLTGFEKEELSQCSEYEFHLNSLNTTWDDRFDRLKQEILAPEDKVISFDVFDTLVKRPLWVPEDVKYFIEYEARDILPDYEENVFIKMRNFAEKKCRELSRAKDSSCEDVTLDEIYHTMGEIYGLSEETTSALMQKEIETELKFIMPRKSGKELYDLALHCGKKVIIVSDMYMSEDTVRAILDKCDIKGYDGIYVSSEYRKLKWSGNLFKVALAEMNEKYGVQANECLHIGDTWHNDIVVPRGLGMKATFLPKAVDVFTGNVGDIYNGNCTSFMKNNLSNTFDTRKLAGQLSLRSMYVVIANNIFDNPFNPFQADSRFNGDPYFMGYYALGTYLMGIAKWVYDVARKNNYDRILFIARDGYLVQKIFDDIVSKTGSNIKSEYIYATRKSVLPYIMDSKEKYYYADNFVNIYSPDYTFLKFLQLFEPVTKEITPELKKKYLKHGIMLDEKIGDETRFNQFINVFLELSFDEDKVKGKKDELKKYFAAITQGKCASFDVGYSGRIQKSLTQLSGHPIDALFLHDNGYSTNVMAESGGFKVHNYYEHSPLVTDILRETFISENAPSCIGFERGEDGLKPVFGKQDSDYLEDFAIDIMQKAALNYCKCFVSSFADYLDILSMRNIEAGYLFEYFCTSVSEFDKFVFVNHFIEDKVYSGFDRLSLVYRWNENLQEISSSYGTAQNSADSGNAAMQVAVTADEPANKEKTVTDVLEGKPRIKRALFYWLFDKETFKQKRKENKKKKKNKKQ